MKHPRVDGDYLRSVIFGCEDGLVSTTGSVIGISVGAGDPKIVIMAGLVIIAVEAISMGAGQFLSEKAVHELEPGKHHDSLLVGSLLMFISYFLAGMIPLTPFLLFSLNTATVTSAILAFFSLFILGYVKGRIIGISKIRSGIEILVVGGIATGIGILVGILLKAN